MIEHDVNGRHQALMTDQRTPSPSAAEITAALDGVLCRGGTYPRMQRAMERVLRAPDPRGSASPAPDRSPAMNLSAAGSDQLAGHDSAGTIMDFVASAFGRSRSTATPLTR